MIPSDTVLCNNIECSNAVCIDCVRQYYDSVPGVSFKDIECMFCKATISLGLFPKIVPVLEQKLFDREMSIFKSISLDVGKLREIDTKKQELDDLKRELAREKIKFVNSVPESVSVTDVKIYNNLRKKYTTRTVKMNSPKDWQEKCGDYFERMEELFQMQKKIDTQYRNVLRESKDASIVKAEMKKCTSPECSAQDICTVLENKCTACGAEVCELCLALMPFGAEGLEAPSAPSVLHVCKAEDIESAKFLSKETKPCPGCQIPIYKTDGCDHMWCSSCHLFFDWKTLKISKKTMVNPEYYAYLDRKKKNTTLEGPTASNEDFYRAVVTDPVIRQPCLYSRVLLMCVHLGTISESLNRYITNEGPVETLRKSFAIEKITEKEYKTKFLRHWHRVQEYIEMKSMIESARLEFQQFFQDTPEEEIEIFISKYRFRHAYLAKQIKYVPRCFSNEIISPDRSGLPSTLVVNDQ